MIRQTDFTEKDHIGKDYTGTVFLDRDGVINKDSPDFCKSLDEFEFIPQSLDALRQLHEAGFQVIVVTNQSMIARGISTVENLEKIHNRMKQAVSDHGGRIHGIFYCPHSPDDGCRCRKPEPGLIFQARAAHAVDLKSATLVGDSARDIVCGQRAGCRRTILVRTGNGPSAAKILAEQQTPPDLIVENLYEASAKIIADAQASAA